MKGGSPEQRNRQVQAGAAKALLQSPDLKRFYQAYQRKALDALREATTPDEAWNARALFLAQETFLGVLHLASTDMRNVEREISAATEEQAQDAWRDAEAAYQEQYKQDAGQARKKAEVDGATGV